MGRERESVHELEIDEEIGSVRDARKREEEGAERENCGDNRRRAAAVATAAAVLRNVDELEDEPEDESGRVEAHVESADYDGDERRRNERVTVRVACVVRSCGAAAVFDGHFRG